MVYTINHGLIKDKINKISLLFVAVAFALIGTVSMFNAAHAEINTVTPSTNEINKDNGWAHVNASSTYDEITLEFVSERNFFSCFEYRIDGDTSAATGTNPNPDITDGRYPSLCERNSSREMTFSPDQYVEVRMVFGAESDERFDWTRFDLLELPTPETKDDCKNGGWEAFLFRNQGQCIQMVNTGKDSR